MLEEVIMQELSKVELTADEEVLEETMACGIGGPNSCKGSGSCGTKNMLN